MKKKIRSRKGFTLTEMLIAVALLALFVSMAAVGTSGLFGTGEQMMTASKAAVLGSDVVDAIANEIRFGEKFYLNGTELEKTKSRDPSVTSGQTSLTFNSASYGDDCTLTLSKAGDKVESSGEATDVELPSGILILRKSVKTGDTATGEATTKESNFLPIGTAAYDEVYISSLTFTCKYSTTDNKTYNFDYIAFSVTISSTAGKTLWSTTLHLEPLYFLVK